MINFSLKKKPIVICYLIFPLRLMPSDTCSNLSPLHSCSVCKMLASDDFSTMAAVVFIMYARMSEKQLLKVYQTKSTSAEHCCVLLFQASRKYNKVLRLQTFPKIQKKKQEKNDCRCDCSSVLGILMLFWGVSENIFRSCAKFIALV